MPAPRSAHTGAHGLYVEVDKPWKVAALAQVLLPPELNVVHTHVHQRPSPAQVIKKTSWPEETFKR